MARPEEYRSEPDNRSYIKVLVGITYGNLLHTRVFDKVGLFDDKLFIDFYLCLESAGFQLLECPGARLIHRRGNYTQKNILGKVTAATNHPAFRQYYITRNRIYLWKVYAKSHPDFVRHDKKTFRKQLLKILLVDDDKWAKLKMIAKGAIDSRRGRFGKLVMGIPALCRRPKHKRTK